MNGEHHQTAKLHPHALEELVSASVRGDMDAFEALFGSAEQALYRMGLSITGSSQDADEALAETALTVLEALASLRRPAYFYTWATRIMINACYGLQRERSKVVPIADLSTVGDSDGRDIFPGDANWADFQDIRSALQQLSEEHRTVVVLRYLEDLTVDEVSQIIGVPEGTVKSRLHYALRQLRTGFDVSMRVSQTGGAARE